MSQLLIVRSLFNLVRDAKIKGTEFVDCVLQQYIDTTLSNTLMLETILSYV